MTTLVARSRWLATAPTLLGGNTVFFDDHAGLAGYGIADEITVTLTDPESAPTLATRLREIEHDNEVGVAGSGPVSFMALPFAAARSGTAHIPQVILGRTRDSKGWVTTVAPANAASGSLDTLVEQALRATNATAADPQRFTLAPRVSHEQWRAVVERALGEIANGRLDKVVLARALDIEADRPFPLENVMARLARLHPSCLRFAVDGFVGASPELLLRKRGDTIQSTPLAGTTGRTGDPEADAEAGTTLLSSAKERREHVFVTEQLRASLDTIATDIVVGEPELHSFRNVMHLGTRITARSAAHPLDLLAALHPTPAVAGTPTSAALGFIETYEPHDRGRYAGPVGWLDASGNATFAVGIRSAELDGARAQMWAGVGVVAGSDPDAELAETQLKFQAMLAALVRP